MYIKSVYQNDNILKKRISNVYQKIKKCSHEITRHCLALCPVWAQISLMLFTFTAVKVNFLGAVPKIAFQ